MPKSYSKMLNPRKAIRRALVCIPAAAALLLWFSTSAPAKDTAPDWLRATAMEKLPDYPAETIAVALLDEQQTTVKDNGEIETRHRTAFRILRPEAKREYGEIAVPFDKETKISYLRAWTITKDGHEIELKDKDATEEAYGDAFEFSDERFKELKFPEANPGSVVGFEVVQKQRPYIFEDDWSFQDTIPVKKARFILQIPAGWEFTTNWFNHAEQKPQTDGSNQTVWELQDIPAVEIESRMPPWDAVAGWVGVKYFPRDVAMRAKTNGSWKDMGVWYNTLTASSRIATPEIKQKVAELTSGISKPVDKIAALTQYVQKNIRYFAIEIGIGGFQPHTAGQIFAHQYGDCKDKATLLSTMLHEIGIESYYVIIHTDRGVVHPDYPSMRFNHAILAIRLPDDVPDTALYAVVNHPKLGRILFFDPTNEYVPFGYLPWYLQDSYGLMVTPDGGELMSLPLLPPATNRLLRTAQFNLSAVGDLSGQVQEVLWGGPAEDSRRRYLDVPPAQRSKVLDEFIGRFLNSFTVTDATVGNLEKYNDTLSIDYRFVAQGYAKSAGNLLIVQPRVVGTQETMLALLNAKKPRLYPIEFHDATRQDDVFDIKLPAGYVVDELPKPVEAECEYASYKSNVEVTGTTLHYKRTFVVKDVMVPTPKLDEVRDFFRQVALDERSSAVLRRATP
jgi:transglutaminase-like putative cysteine protease